jgi:hypothetical protein
MAELVAKRIRKGLREGMFFFFNMEETQRAMTGLYAWEYCNNRSRSSSDY